jgi:hypothetical protein
MSCDPDLHPRWPPSADIVLVVSDKKIFKISANENTLWTLAAMLDFKSATKHKSGRGLSNEHFWQVWFNSVQ